MNDAHPIPYLFNRLQRSRVSPWGTSPISVYSSRSDGNMSLCYGDTSAALANRENFLKRLGIDFRDLVCAEQIHASRIVKVDNSFKGRGALKFADSVEACDGFITREKYLPLAIFNADCLGIFLSDAKAGAVGALHCGWKGAKLGIAKKAVRMMQEDFSSNPADIEASFTPYIRGCCYQVGEEFSEYFPEGLSRRNKRLFLDLGEVSKTQLIAAGLKPGNIFDCPTCTFCADKDYFSFRRDSATGARMISVIMLKGG